MLVQELLYNWLVVDKHPPPSPTGVVSRTFGVMPEKAFKMQAWILMVRFMESKFEEPTISKWLVAGAAAGAATTLIGESTAASADYFLPV